MTADIRKALGDVARKVNLGEPLTRRERELITVVRRHSPEMIREHLDSQITDERSRFASWLANGIPSMSGMGNYGVRMHAGNTVEVRAAYGEGTLGPSTASATPGFLVMPAFNAAVIQQVQEYAGVIGAYELWQSKTGAAVTRPVAGVPSAALAATENAAQADVTPVTFARQAWAQTPTYAQGLSMSFQLVQDALHQDTSAQVAAHNTPVVMDNGVNHGVASGLPGGFVIGMTDDAPENVDLHALVSAQLGQALGLAVAPVGVSALYSATWANTVTLTAARAVDFADGVTAGTELTAKTLSLDTVPQVIEALPVAYRANAAWHFSRTAWANLQRQTAGTGMGIMPNGLPSLYGYPVNVSETLTAHDATASAVSGPVFGDMSKAMTFRHAGLTIVRDPETRADQAELYVRGILRADFAQRDSQALVTVKYAAS